MDITVIVEWSGTRGARGQLVLRVVESRLELTKTQRGITALRAIMPVNSSTSPMNGASSTRLNRCGLRTYVLLPEPPGLAPLLRS